MRRKVSASEFVSLDGVMENPGGAEGSEYGGWSFAYVNEEMGQAIGEGFATSDAMLMGRTTYEAWADFWPSQDPAQNPNAAMMNRVRKYVVSTTLEEPLEWHNSTLIKENVAEEIPELKRQPGKDVVISGSGALVRSLLEDGLIDELNLLVRPVVAGGRKRLFEEGGDRIALELVDSRPFPPASSTSPTGRRELKPSDERSPVLELERGKERAPWLTSQQRKEAPDDDRAGVPIARARHVQADGAAALPLANISRSDGILSVLFGEPKRRFESLLRGGKTEVRSPWQPMSQGNPSRKEETRWPTSCRNYPTATMLWSRTWTKRRCACTTRSTTAPTSPTSTPR
jgi:dihydrofolate reductase